MGKGPGKGAALCVRRESCCVWRQPSRERERDSEREARSGAEALAEATAYGFSVLT